MDAFCPDLADFAAKTVQHQSREVSYDSGGAVVGISPCLPDPDSPPQALEPDAKGCRALADPLAGTATPMRRWLKRGPGGVEEVFPCMPEPGAQPARLVEDRAFCPLQHDFARHVSTVQVRLVDPTTGNTVIGCHPATPPIEYRQVDYACQPGDPDPRADKIVPLVRTVLEIPGAARELMPCHPSPVPPAADPVDDLAALGIGTEECGDPSVDQAAGDAYRRIRFVAGGSPLTGCMADLANPMRLEMDEVAWHHDPVRRVSTPVVRWHAPGTAPAEAAPYPSGAIPWLPSLPIRVRTGEELRLGCATFHGTREETVYTLPDGSPQRYMTRGRADAEIESSCSFRVE